MNSFVSSEIKQNQEIIGDQLKEKRKASNLSFNDVYKKIGINVEYLKLIENGRFNELPVGVYGKNFLREYMYFLGIESVEALDFLQELGDQKDTSQDKLFVQKVTKTHQFLIIPKILKYVVIFFGVLICVLYLAYYIKNIITAPHLVLDNLSTDVVISEHFIDISGQTDVHAEITINNDMVLTDATGNFSKKINLKNGLNVITVVSQKKYSRKNIVVRKIIVQDEN